MAEAAPRISYKGLPGTGVEIVPPNSQEFTDALKLSADSQSLSVIQPILPYSVMIKNGSAQRLLMVTIRIQLVDADGKTVVRDVTHSTRSNRPVNMIAPGSMVFLTPVGGLNTVLPPRHATMHIVKEDRLTSRITSFVQLFSKKSHIEIAIDSAVFDDGGIVGPDSHHTMEMVNSWADAEDSVIRGVLARHGDDITSYLQSARGSIVNSTDLGNLGDAVTFGDRYLAEGSQRFADELLGQRKAFSTEEDFFRYLRTKVETRIPALWRRN